MTHQNKCEKFINFCDRGIFIACCTLAYFLPISIALTEISSSLAFLFFLLKRGAEFTQESRINTPLTFPKRCFLTLKVFKPVNNYLNYPLAWWIGANFIAVFISPDLSTSLRGFGGKILQSVFIYFTFIECVRTTKRLKIFLTVFFISFILIMINGIFQYFVGCGFIRQQLHHGRMLSSFRHANDFAAYLLIVISIFLSIVFFMPIKRSKHVLNRNNHFDFLYFPQVRIILIFLLIVSIACLGVTYSRGAWFSFLVSSLILSFRNKKIGCIAILVGIIFCFIFIPQMEIARGHGTMTWIRANYTGWERLYYTVIFTNNRFGYWLGALLIIKDYPIFGSGLNTYSLVIQNYLNIDVYILPNYSQHTLGGYPHNSYLQMAAEIGLVGLGCFLWMLTALFRNTVQNLKKIQNFPLKLLLLGFSVGFGSFLIHSFFDTNFYTVQLSSLMWLILGVIVAIQKIGIPAKNNVS